MVAASKMKQDVQRLERAKTFGVGSIDKIIQNETYLHKKKAPLNVKKSLLVPITSDKGLCGGTNSNIVREIKNMVKENRSGYRVFVVGDKGSVALARPIPDLMDSAITNITSPINFPTGISVLIQLLPSVIWYFLMPKNVKKSSLSTMNSKMLSVKYNERQRL